MRANGAGECVAQFPLAKRSDLAAVGPGTTTIAESKGTMFGCSEAALASGSTGGPVRLFDVAQHVLFAQQFNTHAFTLGAFERMHVAAGSRTAPSKSAAASITEVVVFPNIKLFDSTIRAVRRERPNTGAGKR